MADEKVTVVDAGGGGGGGTVVALILGVIVLLVVLYVVFGTNMLNGTKTVDANVKVEAPK